MLDRSNFRPNLDIFGVLRRDPGWVYLVKNGELLKIGKTTNPENRLNRDAKTWLPDLELVAIKPFWNIGFIERSLHVAWVRHWYEGEWYRIQDQHDYDFLVKGFREFDDHDRDMNSVDFIYWMNGSGMSEYCMELSRQRLTLPKFRQQESVVTKIQTSR